MGKSQDKKVRRQKDMCMGKSQKEMCPFSYWSAREGNSESTGALVRLALKKCTIKFMIGLQWLQDVFPMHKIFS